MSFVDLRLLVFLPVVFLLHYALPRQFRWLLLLIASYGFYMAWKPEYGLLLLLITTIVYATGLLMDRIEHPRIRLTLLMISILANAGLLIVFKYFDFLATSLTSAMHVLGASGTLPTLSLILPIGISFHVFQSISYSVDVYKGSYPATRHFGKFALYVCFFPQLVAGPIERANQLLKQIEVGGTFTLSEGRRGLKLIAWGFFKKLVIADNIGPAVHNVFSNPDQYTGPSLAIAAALFAYQIYCDFSGYTDIARGSAKLFGYDLVVNFNRPYASRSVSEFWRRWHISLSSWFRDYVYIPLGGNRVSALRQSINILITFTLSGLWHGANWTYVVWGSLNGGYLILSLVGSSLRTRIRSWALLTPARILLHPFQIFVTFSLICIAWIFFRAPDVETALYMVRHLPTGISEFFNYLRSIEGIRHAVLLDTPLGSLQNVVTGVCGIVVLEFIDFLRSRGSLSKYLSRMHRSVRMFLYAAFVISILILGQFSSSIPFIYFQF